MTQSPEDLKHWNEKSGYIQVKTFSMWPKPKIKYKGKWETIKKVRNSYDRVTVLNIKRYKLI